MVSGVHFVELYVCIAWSVSFQHCKWHDKTIKSESNERPPEKMNDKQRKHLSQCAKCSLGALCSRAATRDCCIFLFFLRRLRNLVWDEIWNIWMHYVPLSRLSSISNRCLRSQAWVQWILRVFSFFSVAFFHRWCVVRAWRFIVNSCTCMCVQCGCTCTVFISVSRKGITIGHKMAST